MAKPYNDRQWLFATAYLAYGEPTFFNITKSGEVAGYSKKYVDKTGSRILGIQGIKNALNKIKQDNRDLARVVFTVADHQEVMESLTRDIRFNPKALVDEGGYFKGLHELDDSTAMSLKKIKVERKVVLGEDDKPLKVMDEKVEYHFPDKVAVARLLGEYLGIKNGNRDKFMRDFFNLVLNVQVNNNNEVTPELMAEAIKGAARLIAQDERGLVGQMKNVTRIKEDEPKS